MEEIYAMDEDGGLVLADVCRAKGLPHAVGGRDDVAIHHRDVDAVSLAPGDESMVKVGQTEEDGTAISAAAYQMNAQRPPARTRD